MPSTAKDPNVAIPDIDKTGSNVHAGTKYLRFLRDRYGMTVEGHRKDLMRLVRTRLLRDRVVRYHQMGQERVVALDAVYATRDQAASRARDHDGLALVHLAAQAGEDLLGGDSLRDHGLSLLGVNRRQPYRGRRSRSERTAGARR